MKISQRTLSILSNFSKINSNLVVQEGSVLRTMTPVKTLFAIAKVPEVFPSSFGIYDLNQFLQILSLFDEPELDFQQKCVFISEGSRTVRFLFSNTDLLSHPKKDMPDLNFPVKFELDKDTFDNIMKTSGVLGTPDILIKNNSDESNIADVILVDTGKTGNEDQSNRATFSLPMSETANLEFTFHLGVANMKMISDDYTVELLDDDATKLAKFTSKSFDLCYYVALQDV